MARRLARGRGILSGAFCVRRFCCRGATAGHTCLEFKGKTFVVVLPDCGGT